MVCLYIRCRFCTSRNEMTINDIVIDVDGLAHNINSMTVTNKIDEISAPKAYKPTQHSRGLEKR